MDNRENFSKSELPRWVVSSWNGLGTGKGKRRQGQEEANMTGTIII